MNQLSMKINPLFKAFLETTEEQKQGLEQQILKDKKIIYPLIIGKYTDENGETQEYLIDGHNRYDIAIRHNLSYTIAEPIEFKCISDVYDWIFNQQKNRRNWNEWQEFEAVKKLKEVLSEIGKKKYQETVGRPNKSLSIVDNDSPKHDTRQAIAEKIGWSTGKVAMAEVVAKNAPAETIKQLQKQEISINRAYREVKREQKHKEIEKGTKDLPSNKYRVILADPPWNYGNSGLPSYGHAETHYPSMTIGELCNLKIKDLSEDNAVLFLWVTSPMLEDCFEVINSWGFKYRTSIVWNKDSHNFGYYVSVRHEFLLICVRGSCLPDIKKLLPSVVTIKRDKVHSRKPNKFREMIDEIYPKGKRIELFAREKIKNTSWDCWGNQA